MREHDAANPLRAS